jgi:hypothetical protein
MKIRKSTTALGAALVMMGLSASASAFECGEPKAMADDMLAFSVMIRCDDPNDSNPGSWDPENPLWERRMGPSCEDHSSTAGAFFELSEPKGKNPKGKAPRETGIVVALRQYNFEEALRDLYGVLTDVSGDDVNTQYDPDFATAKFQVMQIKNEISEMIVCVEQLIED